MYSIQTLEGMKKHKTQKKKKSKSMFDALAAKH